MSDETTKHRLIMHGASYDPIGAATDQAYILKYGGLTKRTLMVTRLITHKPIIERFANMVSPIDVRSAKPKKGGKPLFSVSADVVLVHPEMLFKVLEETPKRFFDTLIVVQGTDFKNPRAARFTALRRKVVEFDRRFVYTMGGNDLMGIWSQAFLVDIGAALGKYRAEFYNRYCEPFGFQGRQMRVMDTAVGQIMTALTPITTFIPQDPTPNKE